MYAILIMLIALAPMACKKETNDPNIDDRAINKTINAVIGGSGFAYTDSLDIDNDGFIDFKFQCTGNDSTQVLVLINKDANILTENVNINGDIVPTNKNISSGDVLEAGSLTWVNAAYVSYKSIKVANNFDGGIHGKGDKFFGFQLKKSVGNYLYAWVKVNLSDDHKTFIIKEVAVQKVINKSIKVGEK
jgi:hypothetical protein